jgi:hypothetical protein
VPVGLSGVTAIAAGGGHSLALKTDGTVVGWGHDGDGQATVPAGLTGVTAIAAGYYHSLALVDADYEPEPEPQPEPRPTPVPRSIGNACPAGQIPEDGFTDVPDSNVHEAAIDCVVQWQVAYGRTAGSYAPGDVVNREQMASFIARLVERSGGGLPAASRDHFRDDDTSVHQDSINRLAEAGIVLGKSDGAYDPKAGVTRAQMAAFLVRAYDYRAAQAGRPALISTGDYFDDDSTSPLQPQINNAAAAGFTGGFGDGTYRPNDGVKRDQMGSFLARVLDLIVEQGMASVPPAPP